MFESPAATQDTTFEQRTLPVQVTASTGEYWLLELKNIFLSVVTLGIYSAWAKVNRRTFFAHNTHIDGHHFEFTADPKVVLRSRIIVAAVVLGSTFMAQLSPSLELFGSLVSLLAFPWAMAASAAFNARHTSYQGLSFRFNGPLGTAYKSFYLANALTFFTAGVGAFAGAHRVIEYLVNHLRFGGLPFRFQQKSAPYWKLGAMFMLFMLVAFGAIALVTTAAISSMASISPDIEQQMAQNPETKAGMLIAIGLVPFSILYIFGAGMANARLTNLSHQGLQVGKHRFSSQISPVKLGWIYLSNTAAILASLGLAIPWASLRSYRYRMSKLFVLANGPLLAGTQPQAQLGVDESDAIGDAFVDFDFGL